MARPGPVVVDLPKDILVGAAPYAGPDAKPRRIYQPRVEPAIARIETTSRGRIVEGWRWGSTPPCTSSTSWSTSNVVLPAGAAGQALARGRGQRGC